MGHKELSSSVLIQQPGGYTKMCKEKHSHTMYCHRYSQTDLKDYLCSGSGSQIKSVCLGMNRSKIITLITIGLIQCNTAPLLDDESRVHPDRILKDRLIISKVTNFVFTFINKMNKMKYNIKFNMVQLNDLHMSTFQ